MYTIMEIYMELVMRTVSRIEIEQHSNLNIVQSMVFALFQRWKEHVRG